MTWPLFWMVLCQGLFLTNNVTFIAINGLVGWQMAPYGWMATLPVMGYVVGAALCTPLVATSQRLWGRKISFQIGLGVGLLSCLLCAWAVWQGQFALLVVSTVLAGYYSANGQLYRFAAAELAAPGQKEKAVSFVLAGGLIGAVAGPYLAKTSKVWVAVPFVGAYLALAAVALLGLMLMSFVGFRDVKVNDAPKTKIRVAARSNMQLLRQPAFLVAVMGSSIGYGVMNLLMAATPLAMQACGFPFEDAAWVLQWHVVGMFAPGFFMGSIIKRFGPVPVMAAGLGLYFGCIVWALSGQGLHEFLGALLLLGIGWNGLFTGSTTLSLQTYTPEEKDRAQGLINFAMFTVMAVSSFASGALVTTHGWDWLSWGSLLPVTIMALALVWLVLRRKSDDNAVFSHKG
jgi:MFS family permease